MSRAGAGRVMGTTSTLVRGRVMGTTGKSSKHVAPQVQVLCRGRSQEAR